MKQVDKISIAELKEMAAKMYGFLVKAVVDVEKNALVVDMEYHVDGEQYLLEAGSSQDDLWGINLHPDKYGSDDFVEFDSMINLRPRQNNMSRGIDDPDRQKLIRAVVEGIKYE